MEGVTSIEPTQKERPLVFLSLVNSTGSSLEYAHNSEKSVNHTTSKVNFKHQIQKYNNYNSSGYRTQFQEQLKNKSTQMKNRIKWWAGKYIIE